MYIFYNVNVYVHVDMVGQRHYGSNLPTDWLGTTLPYFNSLRVCFIYLQRVRRTTSSTTTSATTRVPFRDILPIAIMRIPHNSARKWPGRARDTSSCRPIDASITLYTAWRNRKFVDLFLGGMNEMNVLKHDAF